MTFSQTKINILNPLVNYTLRLTTILLVLSIIIWSYFILQGLIEFGHFPKYGDSELISLNGFDRKAIIFATMIMIYGILTILSCYLVNLILKLQTIRKKLIIISLMVIGINLLIMYSSAFGWALD
jgi:hypothetical protein